MYKYANSRQAALRCAVCKAWQISDVYDSPRTEWIAWCNTCNKGSRHLEPEACDWCLGYGYDLAGDCQVCQGSGRKSSK